MNQLTLVLIVVAATIAIMGIAFAVAKARKANPDLEMNETFLSAWNKIRPIVSELFINIFTIYQADQQGYDALVDFAVNYIYVRVQTADFLYEDEKALLTKDIIRTLIEPRLKELYDKKYDLSEIY
jgi:hypothetical protein